MTSKPRVFSGIQPSGNLHLGNYLGAMTRFVDLQADHECLFCVVDLHAVTVWQNPADLTRYTRELTAAYVAAGIDPKTQIIFNQSQVSGHAELAWLLNCVARMGWLNRMTQFKEKAGKNKENASVGLFSYPVLMAADILLYRTDKVPVGDDQKQHLELARDIATKFNLDFAESIAANGFGEGFFPLPEPLISGPATRVMSLRDGSSKMSKSDPSDYSRINLTDDKDAIALKVRKAKTDPEPLPSDIEGLKERPEAKNLVNIYAALAKTTPEAVISEFAGQQFGSFKPALADLAVSVLAPISEEMNRLMAAQDHIDAILRDGAERANALAAPNMKAVKDIMGFLS